MPGSQMRRRKSKSGDAKAAVEGRLPRGFGLKRLVDLPMAWPDQWRALGLRKRRRRRKERSAPAHLSSHEAVAKMTGWRDTRNMCVSSSTQERPLKRLWSATIALRWLSRLCPL